jgi:hypothetical protein
MNLIILKQGGTRMFSRGLIKRMLDQVNKIEEKTSHLEKQVGRLDALLVVRDPGSALSADAYTGLRKQIATLASDRRRALVQIAKISAAAQQPETTLADINLLLEELRNEENLIAITDPTKIEYYECGMDPGGSTLTVTTPAYGVEINEDFKIVRKGTAIWVENNAEESVENAPALTEESSEEPDPLPSEDPPEETPIDNNGERENQQ